MQRYLQEGVISGYLGIQGPKDVITRVLGENLSTLLMVGLLEQACRAIDFMQRQQEPYPAIAVDRSWTILKANDGAVRLVEAFADPDAPSRVGMRCASCSIRAAAHRELGGKCSPR